MHHFNNSYKFTTCKAKKLKKQEIRMKCYQAFLNGKTKKSLDNISFY